MAPPYDTVISIGGQSLIDGVWRLLGPALEGLSNPLPIALPGFTNAAIRITRIIPVVPGAPPAAGALDVLVTVELTAEALVNINVAAGSFSISLGPQQLDLTNLTGTISLPDQNGSLTNIAFGGTFPAPLGQVNFGPGTGSFHLPPSTATLTNGDLTGTLNLPANLTVPGIPLPAVVPVAVNLAPAGPLAIGAVLGLTVTGIDTTTRFGLLINVSDVSVGNIPPIVAASLTTTLQTGVDQIVQQLGIPGVTPTTIAGATVSKMLLPVPGVVGSALKAALTTLLAETGRLIYPPAGTGASCDVSVLPTVGDVQLVTAADGTYVLQVGFGGRPTSSDITAFPAFTPAGIADSTVLIGNMFLLELLCCLVQRLPAFTFPKAAVPATTDINGVSHVMCCNFAGATVDLGPIALNGGVSVCLDGLTGSTKTITLVGHFSQFAGFPPLADVIADVNVPLTFDLDDAASLANLRVMGPATAAVHVNLSGWLIFFLFLAGTSLIGPAVAAVAVIVLSAACQLAADLLTNALLTVLRAAALVRSPAAVPSGVFEAFGKLVPVTVSVDDLTAHSVLQTPTAPWALLPRIGLGRPPKQVDTHGDSRTVGKAGNVTRH